VVVWLNPVLNTSTYYVSVNYANIGAPNPMAGNLSFTIPNFGVRYKMQLDLNNNLIFGEASDLIINGATDAGLNTVSWDGTDGTGAPMTSGCFNVKLDFIAGELHLPLADAENFRGGIRIRRLNGNGVVPNDTIHWNDIPLGDNNETPAGSYVKQTPVSGVNSNFSLPVDTSIRRWESTAGATIRASHTIGYGDLRYMDQWAYDTLSTNVFTPLACFSILPVRIIGIDARVIDGLIQLNWQLSNPISGESVFLVERSNDGNNFSVMGTVRTSLNQTEFQFPDKPNNQNVYYYRVKWKDAEGKWNYSSTRKINMSVNDFRIFKAYPNPATDYVYVELNNASAPYYCNVTDVTGREYINTALKQSMNIDLRSLPSGIYYMRVTDKNGNTRVEKIQVRKK
jgi:hypothetical protein